MPAPDLFSKCAMALGRGLPKLWANILEYPSKMLSLSALHYRLLLATFSTTAGFRLVLQETGRQVYFTALKGAHVLIFSALMLGLLVIVHATQQLVKIQGEEFVGWLLVTIVVREVGPVWVAVFVLIHSGSAVTVELGTMNVTGEIDALRMMGIDPYRYLGAPRLWGITFSLVALYIICVLVAVAGGFLFAQIFAEVFWAKFWGSFLNALQWLDLMVGLSKVWSFGLIIATVSIYFGLKAEKHLGEVARFTSEEAITGIVLCGSVDLIITTAYYL